MIRSRRAYNRYPEDKYEIVYTYIAPASVTLNNGTSSDTVADMQTLNDGNEYAIAEVTGVPGIDLRIEFTGIISVRGLILHAYYQGTHNLNVELYNYTLVQFDLFTNMTNSAYHNYRTILIPGGTDYFDSSGNAVMRLYHPQTGNASHNAYIDYAALLQ